jgi:hypothetical protein
LIKIFFKNTKPSLNFKNNFQKWYFQPLNTITFKFIYHLPVIFQIIPQKLCFHTSNKFSGCAHTAWSSRMEAESNSECSQQLIHSISFSSPWSILLHKVFIDIRSLCAPGRKRMRRI